MNSINWKRHCAYDINRTKITIFIFGLHSLCKKKNGLFLKLSKSIANVVLWFMLQKFNYDLEKIVRKFVIRLLQSNTDQRSLYILFQTHPDGKEVPGYKRQNRMWFASDYLQNDFSHRWYSRVCLGGFREIFFALGNNAFKRGDANEILMDSAINTCTLFAFI